MILEGCGAPVNNTLQPTAMRAAAESQGSRARPPAKRWCGRRARPTEVPGASHV